MAVGLEVVNLLLEHLAPELLADELDHLQRVGETRPVCGVPAHAPLRHASLNPSLHPHPCERVFVGALSLLRPNPAVLQLEQLKP
jgi:hypothetical protein